MLLVEAMAQTAGILAFGESGQQGMLSAIDEARFSRPLEMGDSLELRVTLQASFGRIFRFEGVALDGENEIARARFYLASAEPPESQEP